MGNLYDTSNINNNTNLIKTFSQTKDTTKKIKCKEKNFINFINSSNGNNINSLQNNFKYSKTVKIKSNMSFQKMPFQNENIIYNNILNNGDLINEKNIDIINTNEKNKDKKLINVKTKTNNKYQSYNNLKNFFNKDDNIKIENNLLNNNNFHLIKSEKKLINLKRNYNMKINNLNNTNLLTTNKTFGKSKNIFNLSNTNECITKENIQNKLLNKEFSFCKTENNFYNKKIKNQTKQIKSLINNNHELSNKSHKIKNIFVKQKTLKKFGPTNLKLDTNNKRKDDVLYIKSNNKIIINNNSIINKTNKDNNVISYIYNPNNKNYKISKQNEKKNFININNISQSQKKSYNFENNCIRNENILYNNINTLQEKKINNTNPNIKLCNNQIIYNDNKNIFIQNNYINGKLHTSNEISQSGNNIKKQIYIKNKTFDGNHPKANNNNYITNLKNLLPTSENFKNALNNIKNIFLGNDEKINNKTEEEKNKEINITYNNNNNKITNEKNFEDKSSIIDDSIILNSSDVYGTLNLSKTLNNLNNSNKNLNEDEIKEPKDGRKKPKEINKIKKDENSNENEIYINPYSNYRETITLNMNLNKKKTSHTQKEKEYKKIMISEIIKHNNKSHKKENIKEYLTTNINNNINNTNNKIPKDNTNKIINDINNYKHFSVISIPGKNFGVRKTNQDTPVASFGINGIEGFNIFGVLDGHGTNGHYVSKFLGKYLVNNISKNKEILSCLNLEQIYQVIKKSNYEMLINIFLKADTALSKQNFDVSFSGSTCVLVIQIGKKILCANVGDSRAILVYNNNNNSPNKKGQNTSVYNLSHDFKPDLPEEKKRIYKMGGVVEQMTDMNGMKAGPPRVWGVGKSYPGLAMSRSLGDFKGKKYGIISLPEIIEVNLDENVKYIVACSDGVWEFLSNENVMEIGNEFYEKNDVAGFTRKLAEISESSWEQRDVIVDDITAVVVFY